MKEVLKKLAIIQNNLVAPKNQYNDFGKYKYRSCEDILEGLKPLLKQHNCTVTLEDEVGRLGDRYYIKAKATLTDVATGESYSCVAYAREEENKKGMDGSQVTGASSSYARKYALSGLFAIDDTKDSDSTNKGDGDKKTDQAKYQKITTAQAKELFKAAGNDESKVKRVLEKYQYKSSLDISVHDYNTILSEVSK